MNLKAGTEIMALHDKLDALCGEEMDEMARALGLLVERRKLIETMGRATPQRVDAMHPVAFSGRSSADEPS